MTQKKRKEPTTREKLNSQNILYVDELTGEIVGRKDDVRYVVTNKQHEAIEAKRAKERNKTDNFIFAIFKQCEPLMEQHELEPSDISRIILLATYVNYNGMLMMTERKPMTKTDIKKITRCTNDATFYSFFNNVIKADLLKQIGDKTFTINDKFFTKGELGKTVIGNQVACRLFIPEIQSIFERVKARDIKKLGYLFQLLPHVSYEYNMICWNPTERVIDYIDPMTIGQVADILELSEKGFELMFDSLKQIMTKDNQPIIGQFKTRKDNRENKVIINPKILYRGDINGEEIRIIGSFFNEPKVRKPKKK